MIELIDNHWRDTQTRALGTARFQENWNDWTKDHSDYMKEIHERVLSGWKREALSRNIKTAGSEETSPPDTKAPNTPKM